ncbi:hypothetical protein LTR84_004615 [Exophiala bonariae]|uniref:Coiled-coil domain-containing protein 16 n=1 Tax=Exophiala bonariae TaxID=1690606 RepID=A0AAV9NMV2_9EURO|nr:hypothetical protein LTR84_004615 [Exophiala bonariae]
MADVRALLAAERQSRRITHAHLSYTKAGVLLCNVCNLNVKSEALWEGHLRSANHRKNVLASQEPATKPQKRKIEDIEVDLPQEDRYQADRDGRKKPKSRSVTLTSTADGYREGEAGAQVRSPPPELEPEPTGQAGHVHATTSPSPKISSTLDVPPQSPQPSEPHPPPQPQPEVDEDEWAAFEREVAPLTAPQQESGTISQPPTSYEGATITAAPLSAAQIAQQADEQKRRRLDTEADDEKEDEGRRLEEEFDVMEEMEERVRRLREKREALRHLAPGKELGGQEAGSTGLESKSAADEPVGVVHDENHNHDHDQQHDNNDDDDDDDDDDDEDDWYR